LGKANEKRRYANKVAILMTEKTDPGRSFGGVITVDPEAIQCSRELRTRLLPNVMIERTQHEGSGK